MSKNLINVNVRLNETLQRRLKILAAQTNSKIQEMIARYVEEGLKREEKQINEKND